MKTFVEIHAVQNFAPSNLNRDDTGAPKDAFFGGSRRARISSQCSKKAVRKYFDNKMNLGTFQPEELADRTKRLLVQLKDKISEKGKPVNEIELKIELALNAMGLKLKGEKTEYLLFLGRTEINRLAALIEEKWDEIGDPKARVAAIKAQLKDGLPAGENTESKLKAIFHFLKILDDKQYKEDDIVAIENNTDEILKILNNHFGGIEPVGEDALSGKAKKRKKNEMAEWESKIQDILKEGKKGTSALGKAFLKVLDGGKAVDVALFGRMLADMPEKNQYAACQVAHAISTHAVEREFDFYTAVDDLKPEDTAGADMMGTIEFNSACFYRYAVVDWEKFVANLQGDKKLAEKGLQAFLEGFVVAEPTGMQNSFAAHNPPEFIFISVLRNTAPRNLANAFETPIYAKGKSLTKESTDKLSAKAAALDNLYETKPNARFALAEDVFGKTYKAVGLGEQLESVPKLIKWAVAEVSSQEG
jgi:CRISPR-associated protein Cas7/Cse4/CasC subtype I-E